MEKDKKDWHLVHESKPACVDTLYKAYAEDKKKARVLYFNNRGQYTVTRVIMFKKENGDFEVCHFVETLGISITNKMYRREKKLESLVYKGGKFYYITRMKKCKQLTYSGLRAFVNQFTNWDSIDTHPLMLAFTKKFTWIRFISEEGLLHGMAFNTFVRYKLYNLNDALKHKFNVPLPVIKIIKGCFKDYQNTDMMKIWKEMKQVLLNVENLKPELFGHHLFMDTCKMARTLDKKVNCSWSVKRLVQEHDDWSKEITNTVLEFEVERRLNVAKVYELFAEATGYKLLATNKDLLYEGMTQKHCVGTYISKVDSGKAGIYHIQGYTLELNFAVIFGSYDNETESYSKTGGAYLRNVQLRGKFNKSASADLINEVEEKLLMFNKGLATSRGNDEDIELLTRDKPIVQMFNVDLNENLVVNEEPFPF
jgi:hypothetical protein